MVAQRDNFTKIKRQPTQRQRPRWSFIFLKPPFGKYGHDRPLFQYGILLRRRSGVDLVAGYRSLTGKILTDNLEQALYFPFDVSFELSFGGFL